MSSQTEEEMCDIIVKCLNGDSSLLALITQHVSLQEFDPEQRKDTIL